MGRMQWVVLRRTECRGGVALAHDGYWLDGFRRTFGTLFVDNLSLDEINLSQSQLRHSQFERGTFGAILAEAGFL
jgi:hypothetical protein